MTTILATYCDQRRFIIKTTVGAIPENERKTLYYAKGAEGLQTESATSTYAKTLKTAGAINAAQFESDNKEAPDVSLGQMIAWNPSVIITKDAPTLGRSDELIRTSADWASIDAIRNGRVYSLPCMLFYWFDYLTTANRFLTVQWIANMLYPQAYTVDMVNVTREFYYLFYHVGITEAQAQEILGNSYFDAEPPEYSVHGGC